MTTKGHPEMGFSIGVRGERSAGTMGSFATLTQNGVTLLTISHAVRPASSENDDLRLQTDRLWVFNLEA